MVMAMLGLPNPCVCGLQDSTCLWGLVQRGILKHQELQEEAPSQLRWGWN